MTEFTSGRTAERASSAARMPLRAVANESPIPNGALGRSGDELEGLGVRGADHAEVAGVEGREGADVEAFGDGDDRRVNGAEPQIGVRRDQLFDAEPVVLG